MSVLGTEPGSSESYLKPNTQFSIPVGSTKSHSIQWTIPNFISSVPLLSSKVLTPLPHYQKSNDSEYHLLPWLPPMWDLLFAPHLFIRLLLAPRHSARQSRVDGEENQALSLTHGYLQAGKRVLHCILRKRNADLGDCGGWVVRMCQDLVNTKSCSHSTVTISCATLCPTPPELLEHFL